MCIFFGANPRVIRSQGTLKHTKRLRRFVSGGCPWLRSCVAQPAAAAWHKEDGLLTFFKFSQSIRALCACGFRERVKAGRLWHHACVWPGGRPCAYGAGPAEPAKRAQPIPPPVALSPLPGRTPTVATRRGRRQILAVRYFAARWRVMRRRRPAETRSGEVRPPLTDGVRPDRCNSWSARQPSAHRVVGKVRRPRPKRSAP